MQPADESDRMVKDLRTALIDARAWLVGYRNIITWLVQSYGLAESLQAATGQELIASGLASEEVLLLRDLLRPLRNFSWLEPHPVAGFARPQSREGIEALVAAGVGTIVTLTDEPLPDEWLEGLQLHVAHVPMRDFVGPDVRQLQQAVEAIDRAIARGHSVAIHCVAGRGRTGTVLAAFLVSRGMSPAEAIETVRRSRPRSIESGDQEAAVFAFAAATAPSRVPPIEPR